MKLVFRDVGVKKLSKIVEITKIPDDKNIVEFAMAEIQPYMPQKGTYELVSTDGLPHILSSQYVIVYTNTHFNNYSMGHLLVYP